MARVKKPKLFANICSNQGYLTLVRKTIRSLKLETLSLAIGIF
jgi:hypothetical protein